MLRKIELWNFECHKHSVIDNLHDGLNLVYGDSDSGKTSIIRALKLVAYNDFDPASVRTGKKNCKVRVETDRGWVEVERGKKNIWTTCANGGQPEVFEKIGKNVLPQAASILGLHMTKLGDMTLPVNIMDQDEGHFMLNQLGGDNASGSMRAQIVDEISGLSGIEGLIKDVSLDRHRFGRQVKELEDKAKALRETMHSKKALKEEEELLDRVDSLIREKILKESRIEELAKIYEERHAVAEEVGELESRLSGMPNTKLIKAVISKGEELFGRVSRVRPLIEDYRSSLEDVEKVERRIAGMPDLDNARLEIQRCEKLVRDSDVSGMKAVFKEHGLCGEDVLKMEKSLRMLPDLVAAASSIAECGKIFSKFEVVSAKAFELADCLEEVDEVQGRLDGCEFELREAIKERNNAMKEVKVCPLTGAPISGDCLNGMKFPVLKGEDI